MAIWRGVGGSGESTTNTIVNLVAQYTFDAEAAKIAAQASQTAAEAAKVIAEDASSDASISAVSAAQSAEEAEELVASISEFDPDNFATAAQGDNADTAFGWGDHADAGYAAASDVYTKTEADSLLDDKADQATTYTKTEADSLLAAKANQSTTYTKTEVDASLATKQAADAELTTLSGMATNRATFLASEQAFSMRNRIINGDMRIDQRNAGASVTLTGIDSEFPVDRFKFVSNTTASLALQQVADAPQGFVNSIKATVNTADASPAVGVWMEQPIEGLNVSDLGWGTANAQAVKISFWVKSTLTGTFGASLQNSARNRSYPFTYAISAANTWEQKTVTVAGDTSGTWLTTNGVGIYVISDLGLTGSLRGTAGSWAAADYRGVTSAVSVIGTLSAAWQITGVQLEAGSVATPFERRPYGTELQLAMRYYYQLRPQSNTALFFPFCLLFVEDAGADAIRGTLNTFLQMRTTPTVTSTGNFRFYGGNGPQNTGTTVVVSAEPDSASVVLKFSGNVSGITTTSGECGNYAANNDATANIKLSAEL